MNPDEFGDAARLVSLLCEEVFCSVETENGCDGPGKCTLGYPNPILKDRRA